MKTKISILLATVLMASTSFAQNSSVAEMSTVETTASKGVRVAIVKPMLTAEMKLGGFSATQTLDEALGFSVGYASLPIQQIGWTANATYLTIKNEGSSANMARIDGNIAYAISSLVNFKGGLNAAKLVGKEGENIKAGIGLQLGVGFQITKNFGIDLGYTQMNQSADSAFGSLDFKLSGAEIGLNATF